MAKTVDVSAAAQEISPKEHHVFRKKRSTVPSSELVPLQFRMPPDFVKAYKQAALDRDMKLNELLEHVFDEFLKTSP